eukprot:TRINITY_DN71475_c0_g1_i1.p1 TRINITY_DN71475_c0_g1~~TRINITY_DN71475_c0_g1_i1.p1  ORF type:complete len:122 (+),score=17.72 TRINITY_DN71475_c0_g1_i1:19-384(+)
MSDKQLRKPTFIKVKDLEQGRSGYNVYVKVIEAVPKTIETKDGQKIPMVDCVVADETGVAKAFFKGENAKEIKQNAIIAIRNGIRKIIKGHISLEVDLFGRVTKEDIEIKTDNATLNISDK